MRHHLDALRAKTNIIPAVNQIELHPYFSQPNVQAANEEQGIITQAWSPIGGITFYAGYDTKLKNVMEDPVIIDLSKVHQKTPAQIMLRWHLQEGRSVIPKSIHPKRIAENFEVFDFELSTEELTRIDSLDTGVRGGPNPDKPPASYYDVVIPEE